MKREVGALGLVLLAVGCGGGGGGEPLGDVTRHDLAIMPLPPDQLGDLIEGLEQDLDEAGYNDNAAAADDTLDPKDDAGDLDELGRITGYDLPYADLSALTDGGRLYVASGIDLFGSEDQASRFLDRRVQDYARLRGQEVEDGYSLERTRSRELDGLGDAAWLVESEYSVFESPVHEAVVWFVLGRLVAAVGVVEVETRPDAATVQRLAGELEERIRKVEAGEIDEQPVPIMEPPEPGRDELAALALTLEDLPPGTEVDEETFENGAFTRDFVLVQPLGGSQIDYVASEIELYDTAAEARATAKGAVAVLLGPGGKELLAEAFAGEAGFAPEDLEVRRVDAPTFGDASGLVAGSFDAGFGRQTLLFAYVAVDRALGAVYVLASEDFDPEDLFPLVERQAERLRG